MSAMRRRDEKNDVGASLYIEGSGCSAQFPLHARVNALKHLANRHATLTKSATLLSDPARAASDGINGDRSDTIDTQHATEDA